MHISEREQLHACIHSIYGPYNSLIPASRFKSIEMDLSIYDSQILLLMVLIENTELSLRAER